jgi:hypothetical protein
MRLSPSLRLLAVWGIIILCFVLGSGCGSELLKSSWLKQSSIINDAPDWMNLPAYQVDEINGSITLVNDSSAVYVRLYSHDRRLGSRIRGAGMTVWLTDPKDKTRRIGVHYPMGFHGGQHPGNSEHYLPKTDMPAETMVDMMNAQGREDVEIISADTSINGRKTPDQAEQLGLRCALSEADSAAEYTLKIGGGRLASWLQPGIRASIEVDSPAIDWQRRRERGGESSGSEGRRGGEGGPFGGGIGGGHGGGGRFGGRHGGGEHGEGENPRREQGGDSKSVPPNKPIKVVFTVQLATA